MGFWPIVKKVINDADIVAEIIDARMPVLSKNKEVERWVRREKKPFLRVFNKIDLVSYTFLEKLKIRYPKAFFVSGSKNIGIAKLKQAFLIMAKRNKIDEPLIGIVGYPNTGKSAIINALSKRSKASVSRVAGTTKGIQWVNAGSLRILDSPGVIPFQDDEIQLGLIGAKNPERLRHIDRVVYQIINLCVETKKESLENAYKIKIESEDDEEKIIEKIGLSKGLLKQGGVVDENRVFFTLVRDWQFGKIRLR